MTQLLGILDVDPIAVMLRTALPDLVEIGTASEFARLTAQTIRWPSAYVIPLAESAGANRYQTCGVLDQRVTARFGVVWAVRDIGDRKGSLAIGDIKSVREAGMAALCRFTPANAETACEPVSGRLVSNIDRDGQMLWQDDFTVAFTRRIAAN